MQYNSQREQLLLREYGRTIQDMVNYCVAIPDRDRRQQCAQAIVDIMASMNPQVRQQPDYTQKLWSQLALLSGYRLDIDWPEGTAYEAVPTTPPAPLKYPMQRIRYRHYGHLVEAAMRKVGQMPAGEERDNLVGRLANVMKQDLFDFNRGAMDERKVRADVSLYTEGDVELPDDFKFAQNLSARVTEVSKRKKRRR